MTELQVFLDTMMCVLWILTYTLVLISTIKYKYPTISPLTQMVVAPFEFAVFLNFTLHRFAPNYVFFAYLYWTIIEVSIYIAIIRTNRFSIRYTIAILAVTVCLSGLMYYLVAIKKMMYFFSYFNSLIGDIFWIIFLFRPDYPYKPITLATFITKFVADFISICTSHPKVDTKLSFSTSRVLRGTLCTVLESGSSENTQDVVH